MPTRGDALDPLAAAAARRVARSRTAAPRSRCRRSPLRSNAASPAARPISSRRLRLGRRTRRRQRRDDARCPGRPRRARARGAAATVESVVLDGDTARGRRRQSNGCGRRARGADALVAVGSGTINDLCKYRGRAGRQAVRGVRHGAVDERLHVDERGDHRRRAQEDAAGGDHRVGVFMDLAVLAAAPARMIRAGLGDSLCRSTAQADWLLSHHLLGTPYRRAPFALLADDEPALLRRSRSAAARRPRCDARAGAHAGAVRPRHDDLRRQLSGEPGRAPDQPLHRHARAGGSRRLLPRRAGGRRDADDGAHPGGDARSGAAAAAGRARRPAPSSSGASATTSASPAGASSRRSGSTPTRRRRSLQRHRATHWDDDSSRACAAR